MRVMLIAGVAGTVPRSVQNYHDALARFLQAEDQAGLVVESFSPRLAWLPRERRLRANYLEAARWLLVPAQLRRLSADVFHLLDHSHGGWVGALGGRKSVVTCHDLIPLARPEMWRTWWGRAFGRRMFTRNVERMMRSRAVIAASGATRADIRRFLGGPEHAITVVPMGVDPEMFQPVPDARRAEARARLGLPREAPILLHVGTCDQYKNVNGSLRVVQRVRCRMPDVLWLKVGERFRPENARLVEALHLGPSIRHLGAPALDGLLDAYHAADVLFFPSLYEGFGLPVLEAMACGLPVVTSTGGALPEVAGDAALLCDPEDEISLAEALVTLLTRREERERLVEQGLRRARMFGWDRTARQTRECYRRIVQGERSNEYAAATCVRP